MTARKTVSFDEHTVELIDDYRRKFDGKIPNFSKAVNDIIISALEPC